MRLDWVIPCTAVVFPDDEGPITIEGAGFDCLRIPELPQRINLTVLLRVAGLAADFTEEASRQIEVYLTGPGMENLVALDFEVPVGEAPLEHEEGWELWMFVPLGIGFTAHRAGAHMIEIYLATDRPERLVDPGRRRSIPLFVELSN